MYIHTYIHIYIGALPYSGHPQYPKQLQVMALEQNKKIKNKELQVMALEQNKKIKNKELQVMALEKLVRMLRAATALPKPELNKTKP